MKNLFATLIIICSALQCNALSGSWRGNIAMGQAKLPIVFNFTVNDGGNTLCTLDSPAQGVKAIPAEVILCTPDSVSVSCAAVGATYSGRITANKVTGIFTQRGMAFPLDLTPEAPLEERRPQTPRPPFPYESVDTTFTAPDGAVLSATLTLPLNARSCKTPAVVMVTGSGPQNRDEEIAEHRPFAVIADWLARNGIASLRYDDRGTAKSTGDAIHATTHTLKDDAAAGIALLRTLAPLGKVGVLGHSEGGTIAFMLAAEGNADFVVSLAGMAESGKETLMRQNSTSLDKAGLSNTDKENSLRLINMIFDTMAQQWRSGKSATVDVDSLARSAGIAIPAAIAPSLKLSQQMRSPWLDAFTALNPRDYLAKVKCPLLAINGTKDTQVHPHNLEVIGSLVPRARTLLMPDLNHLMQHAQSGEVSEYGQIRETISPDVLAAIVSFVNSL